MKKLLYIGHSYHKKTKSTEFLINLLKETYNVTELLDDSWETGIDFDTTKITDEYHSVVFFQLIPRKDIFEKITHKNIIFFPMYDGISKKYMWWYTYRNIKIFNFSKTLHTKLKKWGFNSHHVQYFIPPIKYDKGSNNEVFFWQRITDINKDTVIQLFKNKDVKLHIHKSIDPYHTFLPPTKEEEDMYNITYSTWFDTKTEMQDFIFSKTFYIAPRIEEGIGMTFLEAMAMGKVVIANNAPTMNEYIKDGYNGYLRNFKNPKPLPKKIDINFLKENTYEYMSKGFETWLSKRSEIIAFIEKDNTQYKRPFILAFSYLVVYRFFYPLCFFVYRVFRFTKRHIIRLFFHKNGLL